MHQDAIKHGRGNGCATPDLSVMRDPPPPPPPTYLIKMASECESELNIDEEMSNVCVHIPQNLNWIWSQKGRQLFHKALQIVSNAENETGESSAAQTLLSKTFQHNEDRCDV